MDETWPSLIEAWATAQRAARLSSQTIDPRIVHLGKFRAWAGDRSPWTLTLGDLSEWTDAFADGLPPIPPQPPRPRPARYGVVQDVLVVADDRVRLVVRLAHELGMRRGVLLDALLGDSTLDVADRLVVAAARDELRTAE
jgi:integrase/recombinase XerC